jgi:hypothetical protein
VIGSRNLLLVRHLARTMGDALRQHGLEHDRPLRTLLGMLIEDTVHSGVDRRPWSTRPWASRSAAPA